LPLHSKKHIRFTLNGERTEVAFAPHKTLLEVLREDLNLTGTKHGCELCECGTCAVLVDGRSILSCLMLCLDAEDREVKTIEGMADGAELHPLQQTFADLGAAQCGYCSPGFLLVAEELLKKSPNPSRAEIQVRCREICVGAPGILKSTRLSSSPRRECAAKRWNYPKKVFSALSEICVICG
jgi:aerobic-type carbon monoxide dehydrogenase small subunit (CoxS/CutS family)